MKWLADFLVAVAATRVRLVAFLVGLAALLAGVTAGDDVVQLVRRQFE